MISRRAWLVFAVGTSAYLVGVMQRSSLGIAGVEATERFGVQAATLSTLAVVQLVVYAALQVPVGVVLDRVGPRVLIASGAVLMAGGQTLLALTPEFSGALVARVLVGAGDALTFISMQRIVAAWMPPKRVPLMSQLLGTIGQLGQVLSMIPLSLLLHSSGWTPAYLSAASTSVVVAVLVVVIVRSQPESATLAIPLPAHRALTTLREAVARPGTQLGFWSHYVTQSPGTMFALLWGVPFLSVGVGLGPATAGVLLSIMVFSAVVFGPVLGLLSARYPMRRSNLVFGVVAVTGAVWAVILAWPGTPPIWLIVVLVVVLGVGGPGSLIGFDFARTFNPARSLGSANGIVNSGGFLASFAMAFLVGVVLDALDRSRGGSGVPRELYSFDAFRVAFLVQYLVVGVGVVLLVRARRRTRSRLAEDEGISVAPIWVAVVRRWRHRGTDSPR